MVRGMSQGEKIAIASVSLLVIVLFVILAISS
jgi:hypothetical protein